MRTARWLDVLLAVTLAPLLSGGSCSVSGVYCSEDCDPCVTTCKCANNQTCEQATSGGAGNLRLESYVLTLSAGDDGSFVQTLGSIVGLSVGRSFPDRARERGDLVDRAREPGERVDRVWERSDLVRFADAVLRANQDRLGPADGWRLAAVERFGGETVVAFERADGSFASLAFLFDRAGDLVEIVRETASTPRR